MLTDRFTKLTVLCDVARFTKHAASVIWQPDLFGSSVIQVFENEMRVYAEEGIDVKVSASLYTSSCLRMLTGKRDGVLPV